MLEFFMIAVISRALVIVDHYHVDCFKTMNSRAYKKTKKNEMCVCMFVVLYVEQPLYSSLVVRNILVVQGKACD